MRWRKESVLGLALASLLIGGTSPHPGSRVGTSGLRTALALRQDYCSELQQYVTFSLQPTGPTCCWTLSVNNTLPSGLSLKPTLQLTANRDFLGMTLASGWAFTGSPTFPTPSLTLSYSPGPIPPGTTGIGRFCLDFQNNTSATLTIQWSVSGPTETTCSTTVNLTCPQGCWVCGQKFEDLNGNGKWDGNEPLLPNWTITLTDAGGNTVTTQTNPWGMYCFYNLDPSRGPYTISEGIQSGWQAGPMRCFKFIPIPGNQPTPISCGSGTCQFNCEYRQDINRYDCIMCSFPNVQAAATAKECEDRPQNLNTGWDQRTSTSIPLSGHDEEWLVLQDPDPGTSEPRPATVIFNSQTRKQPQSEWISADQLGRVRQTGQYVFQRCFCLDADDLPKASLRLSLWAAEEAIVFLNRTQIGVTPPRSYQQPDPTTITVSSGFRPGLNCLQVVVTGGPSSFLPGFGGLGPQVGFDLVGEVTAPPDLCCEGGTICGVKFEDVDGNGRMDSQDRPLAGWTIVLRDDQGMVVRTETTDRYGAYCFRDLPPGRYTVSEVSQSGWTQTYPPAPGTHTVDLDPKEVITHRDFGNRKRP